MDEVILNLPSPIDMKPYGVLCSVKALPIAINRGAESAGANVS